MASLTWDGANILSPFSSFIPRDSRVGFLVKVRFSSFHLNIPCVSLFRVRSFCIFSRDVFVFFTFLSGGLDDGLDTGLIIVKQ